jgi:choline monooxygenase
MTDIAQRPTPQPMAPTDPELVVRARRLVEAGTTELAPATLRVPLEYYRDREQLAQERALLLSTPLALMESARLPNPNDFVVRDVLGTSVIVTRNSDGEARALVNYCRHRGARTTDGCGSARRFTCPYHGWTYDGDGVLVGLPGGEGFDDLDRAHYGLVQLPCEERHGLVWVVLTAGLPVDVRQHLGPLDDEVAGWGLASYEWFTEREFESEVSWKAAMEAFAENYHFPYVHRQSIVGTSSIGNTGTFDTYGPHHRLGFPTQWIADLPEGALPMDGMALIYWIFPNLTIAVSPVGVEIIDILPAGDPLRCHLRHGWMARHPAAGDETTLAGYADLYEQVHAAVRDEDFGMLPRCADGIRNGQHGHMVIGRNEPAVQNVVRNLAAATGFDFKDHPVR